MYDENENFLESNGEASRFVVPKDVRNPHMYSNFSYRPIVIVPSNANLLCYNKFTGDYTFVRKNDESRGMIKFLPPWIESILVTTSVIPNDYKAQTVSHPSVGNVKVDAVLYYRIANPKKYVEGSSNISQALFNKINEAVRLYVASSNDPKSLLGKKVPLDNETIKNICSELEKRYGVRVETLTLDSISLSESMQSSYEDITKAQNEQTKAKIDAETEVIKATAKAKAKAMMLKQMTEAITSNQSFTQEQQKELLTIILMSLNENAFINFSVNGQDNISSSIASGIAMGNRRNKVIEGRTKKLTFNDN